MRRTVLVWVGIMRGVSLFSLVAASLSLAACAGGGGSSIDALSLAKNLEACIKCGTTTSSTTTSGGTSGSGGTTTDADGDGQPDAGSNTGGNPTVLTAATGAPTVALEKGAYVIPTEGTALMSLSATGTTSTAENAAAVFAILGAAKPTKLQASIYTATDSNSSWPVPVLMNEYAAGTNKVDPFNSVASGQRNAGAGSNYREYRAISSQQQRDELLQVWAYDDSYMLQYRNAWGGQEGKQQAWSFGGNATTGMRNAGTANYTGRFVGTAKTENWYQADGVTINPNALWQLQGRTDIAANFGTSKVTGTLTPETWTSFQEDAGGNFTWYTGAYSGGIGAPSVATAAVPNFNYYNRVVGIDADITKSAGNNTAAFTGTATLDGGYVSGDNPVYGGFYGTDGAEVAGAFNVYGVSPYPIGGGDGITDDRRGYLTINGVFHGNCAAGDCTP